MGVLDQDVERDMHSVSSVLGKAVMAALKSLFERTVCPATIQALSGKMVLSIQVFGKCWIPSLGRRRWHLLAIWGRLQVFRRLARMAVPSAS